MEPGKSTKVSDEGRGQVHVYPYNKESTTGHAQLRTHESVISSGIESLQNSDGKPVSVLKLLNLSGNTPRCALLYYFTLSIVNAQNYLLVRKSAATQWVNQTVNQTNCLVCTLLTLWEVH
jgi:hypothetical protein